jgi:dTDP-4-dehydrorhamnose 3,5-epimerase
LQFVETPLGGAWIIEPNPVEDERGWFARIRCEEEFKNRGLERRFVQSSLSFNRRRGVLRGLHFQVAPHQEVKLVRCVRGAIHDVIVDLRRDSPTFTQHFAAVLSGENRRAMYVPRGFAHGFQALEEATEVLYEISEPYSPKHARGVRWDDPVFGITWPIPDPILLDRDRRYPDFSADLLQ